jgi:hypothetical protein
MFQRTKIRGCFALLALLCATAICPALPGAAGVALAQNPNGQLIVTVKDESEALVPSATITVTNDGTGASQTGTANDSGTATFAQLPVGTYTVQVEAPNFQKAIFNQVKIEVGKDYGLVALLSAGSLSESVTVTAGESLVTTSNAELTNTVTSQQVRDLPLDGRDPLQLIQLQPGVSVNNGRGGVTVNAQRTSSATVTQDGITIQDYAIRTNALTFSPNRTTVAQVSEFSVTTQNGGSDQQGASQVRLVTPSGTNAFHGEVFEFHRNDALGANDFFNNLNGIERPQLIRNQFGFAVGGPIFVPKFYDGKDKFFFFGSYEGFRERTAVPVTRTVFTPAARSGIFQYRDVNTGQIRSINVLNPSGTPVDPVVSNLLGQVPLPNSALAGDQLVTSGFSFNQSSPTNRNQGTTRLDYVVNDRHRLGAIYQYTGERNARPDIDTGFRLIPVVSNTTQTHFAVASWNWTITDNLTNDFRVGLNNSTGNFISDEDTSSGFFVLFPLISDPQVAFDPQGRRTIVSSLLDDASYVWGSHFFRFGTRIDRVRLRNRVSFTVTPQISLGLNANSPDDLPFSLSDLPGASSTDVARANALLAALGGYIGGASREFNVNDRSTTTFQPIPQQRNYALNEYALYVQDQWRLHPRVTLNLGVRWDYTTPLREVNDLGLLPTGTSGPASLLDPNGGLDFVNGFFFNPDKNNFSPNAGIAWDLFGDGKTVVRTSLSLAYINDETVRAVQILAETNPGLNTTLGTPSSFFGGTLGNDIGTILGGTLAPPQVQVPLTFADVTANNPAAFTTGLDPTLKTPYYIQWSFGIEREIGWDSALSIRYVGNRGKKLLTNINYNQIDVVNNGFAADVARARQNGFLALEATGRFDPRFNSNIPGSQPLPVIDGQLQGGLITNPVVLPFIVQGTAADLAQLYVTNGLFNGFFLPNPNAFFAILLDNGGYSTYDALQVEERRRFSRSLGFQANYTWSKALGFGVQGAVDQLRQDFPLDIYNQKLDYRRQLFDTPHVFKANVIYELPFGDGRWFDPTNPILEKAVSGFELTSIFYVGTGAPISIFSSRGTFTPGSSQVYTSLTADEIKDLFGFFETPDGIFYINPSVIGPDGTAVSPDGEAPFPGQVFFNAGPGETGALQALQFNGPTVFNWDASIIKNIAITENVGLQLRGEFFNVLNKPIFFSGSHDINSPNFGRITQTLNTPRVVQLAAKITF